MKELILLFINMDSYSVDCSGYNQVIKELSVKVNKKPAPTFLDIPSNISVSLDDTMCIDYAEDTINIYDTLALEPYSGNFNLILHLFHHLIIILRVNIIMKILMIVLNITVSMIGYSHVGNVSSAIQKVALRFCWVY